MKHIKILFFIFLGLFFNCVGGGPPEFFNNQVAQLELEAAVDAKRKDCGDKMKPPQNKSPYPKPRLLVYQKKVNARSIRLCSAAILRTECPFVDYPIICLYIYVPVNPSLGFFRFNEMNKDNRFKPDDYF